MSRKIIGTSALIKIFFILVGAFLAASFAHAQTPEVTRGIAWLKSSQKADGSWGSRSSFRDTAVVVESYRLLGQADASYQSAVNWINAFSLESNDYLAKRILSQGGAGADVGADIQRLVSYQNPDGGWGYFPGYDSDVYDTVVALNAVSAASQQNAPAITRGIGYLLATQNAEGSWSVVPDGPGDVTATSFIALLLHSSGNTPAVTGAVARAIAWLNTKQNPDGGFGSSPSTIHDTVYALDALLASGQTQALQFQTALQYITTNQLANGSWADSPYETATAIGMLVTLKPNVSLAASDVTFSLPSPKSGDVVTIQAVVRNTGRNNAYNIPVQAYAETPDHQIVPLGGTQLLPFVPINGSATVAVDFDTAGRDGLYTIHITLDPENVIEETTETDNQAAAVLPIAPLKPDFAIAATDIIVSPLHPKSGEPVMIRATVRNVGTVAGTDVPVAIVAESPTHEIIPVGATQIIATLPAGGSATVEGVFDTTNRTGAYAVRVTADADNAVPEIAETNNQASIVLTLTPAPDLAIAPTNIVFSNNSVRIGDDVMITATVLNRGNEAATDISLEYYFESVSSTNLIGAAYIPYLAPGEAASRQVLWKTNRTGPGVAVYVVADPQNKIAEFNEANNQAYNSLEITQSTQANLTLSYKDISFVPPVANQGGSVLLSALVKNEGFSSADGVDVSIYRGIPGIDGVLLGSRSIPGILPGATATVSYTWADIAVFGQQIVYVKVDPANTVPEYNETDNDAFASILILALPDLTLSTNSISVNPAFPKDGDTVALTAAIQNTGQQDARNVVVKAFEGTAELGSRQIPLIAVSSQATVSIPYDTTGKQGVHEITIIADPDNGIREQNKDNNRATRTFGVQNGNLWLTEQYISPDGDGIQDGTRFFFRFDPPATVSVQVTNGKGETVRTFSGPGLENIAAGDITWDGLDDNGMLVDDGQYHMEVRDLNRSVIGSLLVTVDTNRSPLTDAMGTKYLLNNNLTCLLPDIWQWKWFPDESGILALAPYDPNTREYPSGLYTVSPDGQDIVRIVPSAWSSGVDATYDYTYLDYDVSPDSEHVALILNKFNKKTWKTELNQLWVMDRDGSKLVLLDSYDAQTRMYDFKWSTRGDYMVYRIQATGSPEELWLIRPDGAGKIKLDAGGYFDFNYLKWSPDGDRIAYLFGMFDASGNYIQRIRIADLAGNTQDVFSVDNAYYAGAVEWLGAQKLVLVVAMGGLWLVDASGSGNHLRVSDRAELGSLLIAPDRQKFVFVTKDYDYGGDSGMVTTSVYDATGNAVTIHELTSNGRYCEPYQGPVVWSPDSGKITFSERVASCAECGGECNNTYGPRVAVVDVRTASKASYAETMQPFAWLANRVSILGSTYSEQSWGIESICSLHAVSGEKNCIPMGKEVRLPPYYENPQQYLSPHEHYLPYYQSVDISSVCYGRGYEDLWVLSSLLNLTAELRAVRAKSAVILKGIAADLNFDGYRLEYADAKNPGAWIPVQPPSDIPVINGVFTTWIPPSEGTFYVRLTVWDKAGNKTISRKRVSWGLGSSITNLYKSTDFFSPNGDAVQDTVEVHYKVLEPVNLEFNIYDDKNALVRTFRKSYTTTAEDQISWDGRDSGGTIVPDGSYKITVLDYELFVVVDTTFPDADIAFAKEPFIEQRVNGDPFLDLLSHATDINFKKWAIQYGDGAAPREWYEFKAGNVPLPVREDDFGREIPLHVFTTADLKWLVGKTFKIVAEDLAGNKRTVLDPVDETILFYKYTWQNALKYIVFDDFLTTVHPDFEIPGAHEFMGLETISMPLVDMNVQYFADGQWFDAPQGINAPPDVFRLDWDIARIGKDISAVRVKAHDVLGQEHYSNIVPTDPGPGGGGGGDDGGGGSLDGLIINYKEAECGLHGTEAVVSASLGSLTGTPLLKTLTYTIQKPEGIQVLRQFDLAKEGFGSVTIDTSGMPEGLYPVKAVFAYRDAYNIDRERSVGGDLIVDRVFPVARLNPAPCVTTVTDAVGTFQGLSVAGDVEDNIKVKRYELYYGVGDNPSDWEPATARVINKFGQIVQRWISGVGAIHGVIGVWDVSDIAEGSYTLKLKVVDLVGNVSCETKSVSIDRALEIASLTADLKLFSPNGDSVLDEATVAYQIDDYALVDVKVFTAEEQPDHTYALGTIPVRTILAGNHHVPGAANAGWDGRNDALAIVADGHYGISVFAMDSCGHTTMKWVLVEVDNTRPTAAIVYPTPTDLLGNTIVEIRGTADDLHFSAYTLEVGSGDLPASWLQVAAGTTPVKDRILGKWNTFGLNDRWTVKLTAIDTVGNSRSSQVTIDFGSRKTLIKELDAAPKLFSPNNDGKRDSAVITYELTDAADATLDILDASGATVRTYTASRPSAGVYTTAFDGRNTAGTVLPDGVYSVRLTAALASNSAVTQTETITVAVDATPPAVDIRTPADGSYIKTDITVNGTINDLNLQEYALGYTNSAGPVSIDQGNQSRISYIFGVLNDLPEEAYSLSARAKDLAENETTKTIAFTIDRTPPVVKLETPKDGELFGAEKNSITITGSIVEKNLDTFRLRYGPGDSPAQWIDLLSGTTVPTNPQLLAWKVGKNDGIPDGVYTLSLLAKDKAGLMGEAKVKITVDNTPPEVSLVAPKDGDYVRTAVDITGTATDQNLDKYTLELAEGRCDGAFKWAPLKTSATPVQDGVLGQWQTLPSDGEYCLRLTAIDKLGSTAEAKVNVKVDTHPPAAPSLSGTVDNRVDARLDWPSNTEPDMAGYNLYRAGQKINTELIKDLTYLDQSLGEGLYAYTLKAVDLAGWESRPSNEVKLRIDLTGPDARIRVPQDGSRVSGLIEVKGTAYSVDDFKQYRLSIGQGAGPSAWSLARTSPVPIPYGVLVQWDTLGLAEGQVYSLKLEAEDTSGNVNTHRISVTIDNTPPAKPQIVSATASNADAGVTWNANTESDLAGYLLYRNDQLANVTGVVVGDLKPYLITGASYLDKTLPDGTFRYYLVAVDQAGNQSEPSDVREATIDTHPPHATIVDPAPGAVFENTILVKAESPDLDIAKVQFEYKKAQDSVWTALGAPVTSRLFVMYLDPAGLALAYGNYQLRAVATDKGNKTDPAPSMITVTYTDLTAPAAPAGLTAKTTGADVTLTWTANTETDLDGYNVYRTFSGTRTKVNAAIVKTTQYQDTGLADGTYTYEVTAVDTHANESKPSNSAPARVYVPVLTQPYTPAGQGAVQVEGSNAEAHAVVDIVVETGAGFELRGTGTADGSGAFTIPATLFLGENRLSARASDSAGNVSRNADAVIVVYNDTPGAPAGLATAVQGHDVSLLWNPNPEPDILGYNLYRNGLRVNSPDAVASGTTSASSTKYPEYYNSPDMAMDADPSSYWTPESGPLPEAPVWWEVDLASPELISRLDIRWSSDTDGAGNEVLYAGKDFQVQVWSGYAWVTQVKATGNGTQQNAFAFTPAYRTDRIRIVITTSTDPSGANQVRLAEVAMTKDNPVVAPAFVDLNLPDKQYTYTVTAVDQYGFESSRSDPASALVGDIVPPSAPQGLAAVAVNSDVVLTWTANAEPDAAGYNVYRATAQGWVKVNTALVAGTLYADVLLPNGTYTYRITAVDAVGNESEPSNAAMATVAVAPPATPGILTVTPLPEGGLNAEWLYEGVPATAYNLYRSTTAGGPYNRVNPALLTAFAYLDTGVVSGVTYYYVVAAVDGADNEGPYSNEASGTARDSVPPAKPMLFFPTVAGVPVTLSVGTTDVAGSGEPGLSVDLFRSGSFIGSTTASDHEAVTSAVLTNYEGSWPSLSPDGNVLAYDYNGSIWLRTFSTGSATKIINQGYSPLWSPDGSRIAYVYEDGGWQKIGIYDVATGTSAPLTNNTQAYEYGPSSWSADGSKLVFTVWSGSGNSVWVADVRTGDLVEVMGLTDVYAHRLSPDGTKLAYFENEILLVRDLASGADITVDDNTDWYSLDWSGDGAKLVFVSYRGGTGNIMVLDLQSGGQQQITSLSSDPYYPLWSADGTHIFYDVYDGVNDRDTLWVTDVRNIGQARQLMPEFKYLYALVRAQSGAIAFVEGSVRNTFTLHILRSAGYFAFPQVSLSPGENLFTATARDSADNLSESSDAVSVTFDTVHIPDLAVSDTDVFLYPPFPILGEQAAINISVWNRSQVSVGSVEVTVYVWNALGRLELLKSERIPMMEPQSATLVTALWDSTGKAGENRIVVVVDPEDKISELVESNNVTIRDFFVADSVGVSMATSTDAPQYNSNQAMNISVTLRNSGAAADGVLHVQLEEGSGYPVTVFDSRAVTLAYASTLRQQFLGNTGSAFAGPYRVHAVLRDAAGAVLAENVVPVTIASDAVISTALVTDKRSYGPNERVGITATLANGGTNEIIPALTERIVVTDSAGSVLFSEERPVTALLPGGSIALPAAWNTGLNPAGGYAVVLTVFREGQEAAHQTTAFTIDSAAAISGTVIADPSVVFLGGTVLADYTVQNSGNADAAAVELTIAVIDPETQAILHAQQETVDLSRNSSRTGQASFATTGYGLKPYVVVLSGNYAGTTRTLASAAFTVKDLRAPVVTILEPASGMNYTTTVPLKVAVSDDASGVDRVEYQLDGGLWKLLPVVSPADGTYGTVWEPTPADGGPHSVSFRATDKAGNTSAPVSVSFFVRQNLDTQPPVTTLLMGTPTHEADGTRFIAAGTVFTLLAADDLSGVAGTEYRIDSGPWMTYAAGFTLAGQADGPHSVGYRSTDNAGNTEAAQQITVVLDTAAPVSAMTATDPLGEGIVNIVSPNTEFTISATDALAGVKSTVYRIDSEPWQFVSGGIRLTGRAAGTHTIAYKATDNVMNEEAEKVLTVRLIVLDVIKEISSEPLVLLAAKHADHHHRDCDDNRDDNRHDVHSKGHHYECDDDHHDDCRDEQHRTLAALEKILADHGISYAVVGKKEAFRESLRSGRFTAFFLVDYDRASVKDELREAVHAGAGLIVIKTRPDNGHEIDDILGVKFTGESIEKGLPVTLVLSPISDGGTLATDADSKIVRVEQTSSTTQIIGYVQDRKAVLPAILFNQYGNGKALLYGFDLLASPEKAQVAELVVKSISFVHPQDRTSGILSGIPIGIRVTAMDEPVDIRVQETLPADATAAAIRPPATPVGQTITWELSLAAHETAVLEYALLSLDTTRAYTPVTAVSYLNNGEYRLYGNYPLTVQAMVSPADLLPEIAADLRSLTLTAAKDAHLRAEALKALSLVNLAPQTEQQAEKAIDKILDAVKHVRKISVDITAIRLKLDILLSLMEQTWYLLHSEDRKEPGRDHRHDETGQGTEDIGEHDGRPLFPRKK